MHKLTFLFLFFTTFCRAQDFGNLNAQWVYDYKGGHAFGVTLVEYDRDTIIMGDTIKLFFRTYNWETSSGVITSRRSEPIYIRDRNQVVEYSYVPTHFDTLYNFNADIGSSWTIRERRFDGTFTGERLTRTVLDTFHYDFNGVSTFCQEVQSSTEIILDTICSGIGSRIFYIDPFDYLDLAADGGEGGFLRCFSNDAIGGIQFVHPGAVNGGDFTDFEYDCGQLTSLQNTPTSNTDFDIYPNPVVDVLHIESSSLPIEHIAVYTLQGQQVYAEALEGRATSLDTSAWVSGMYYVIINGQYFEKLVVGR